MFEVVVAADCVHVCARDALTEESTDFVQVVLRNEAYAAPAVLSPAIMILPTTHLVHELLQRHGVCVDGEVQLGLATHQAPGLGPCSTAVHIHAHVFSTQHTV